MNHKFQYIKKIQILKFRSRPNSLKSIYIRIVTFSRTREHFCSSHEYGNADEYISLNLSSSSDNNRIDCFWTARKSAKNSMLSLSKLKWKVISENLYKKIKKKRFCFATNCTKQFLWIDWKKNSILCSLNDNSNTSSNWITHFNRLIAKKKKKNFIIITKIRDNSALELREPKRERENS